jgi:hypothetical protein
MSRSAKLVREPSTYLNDKMDLVFHLIPQREQCRNLRPSHCKGYYHDLPELSSLSLTILCCLVGGFHP